MITVSKKKRQLIVDIEDGSLLKSIKQAISLLKGVSSVKESEPIKMTEKQFFQKLDDSIASMQKGKPVRMKQNESGKEFLERILCLTK